MAEQIEQSYLESLEVENKRLKRRVERMTKELRHMVNLHDRSVSLRIYSEHEMLLQKEAAEAATRAKSAFLASMSHEIRTPLNAVIGMAEVAKKELPVANIEAHKAFDEILIASRHLLGILNNVLDFSKIESGKLDFACESFALKAALESVEAIILPRCQEKNLELASNVSKLEEISVMGDELRLKQVLINLLGNAVKFTPDQGRIQFFVDVKKLDPRKAEEEAAVQAGIAAGEAAVRARLCEGTPGSPGRVRAFFAVKDNGIGIAPQHIDKLFVAFEQSDTSITKQFGGTGLGLAICQRLVTEMGGEITVASELGKGSRFQFTLDFDLAPISRSAFGGAGGMKSAPGAESESGAVPDLWGKKILVVEDMRVNRLVLSKLLQATRAELTEAETGEDALELLKTPAGEAFDLIFMDIQMPGIDGYETTRAIRELGAADARSKLSSIPIFAMTANAYREDVEKALVSGMNGHISKPIQVDLLMNTLKELFHSQL